MREGEGRILVMREGDGKINKGGIIKGGKGSLKGILSKDKKVH